MSVRAFFALDTLDTLLALCAFSSVSYSKDCSVTVSKCNCISIDKSYGISLRDRRNTVTSITLNAFSGFSAIYAVNVPSAVLNGNDGGVSVFTLFALDTLNTLFTLCASSSVSNSEGCSITIRKGNRVNINKSYGACFGYRGNTVTGITLDSLSGFATIYAVDIPSAVLNGDNRGVSIFTLFTLDTLNTLFTLCASSSVSYGKGRGVTIGECNCVGINKSFGFCFCDRRNTVTSITLDSLSGFATIYAVDIPSAVLNGDNRSVSVRALFALDTLNTLRSGSSVSYSKCCTTTVCVSYGVSIYQAFGFSFLDLFNTVSSNTYGRLTSIYTINVPSAVLYSNNGCMSVLTGNALNALLALCSISTIGHGKCSSFAIGESNCVGVNKSYGISFSNRGNAITCIALDTFSGFTAIYTINVPLAVLNGDNRSVSVRTFFTLDTLNTLCALCSGSTVGYGKGSGIAISERYRISINKSFGFGLCDRRNAVTSITLNALSRFTSINTINVPSSVFNSDNGGMSVLAGNALNALNTLFALYSGSTIGYRKGRGIAISECNRISINKSFGLGLGNRRNAISGITFNTLCSRFICIYTINIPISILNGNNGTMSIFTLFTLDSLNALCTVRYGKCCRCTVSIGNGISVNQTLC